MKPGGFFAELKASKAASSHRIPNALNHDCRVTREDFLSHGKSQARWMKIKRSLTWTPS